MPAFDVQEFCFHRVVPAVLAELKLARLGESMYRRNDFMADVTVTSATPQVQSLGVSAPGPTRRTWLLSPFTEALPAAGHVSPFSYEQCSI